MCTLCSVYSVCIVCSVHSLCAQYCMHYVVCWYLLLEAGVEGEDDPSTPLQMKHGPTGAWHLKKGVMCTV